MTTPRLYLSPPHMSGEELRLIQDAFASNWIAPLGPHVDAFEREFASAVGVPHAAALSSGTAALHLALQLLGVKEGDEVLVSTLTFAASAFPVRYLGAHPTFVDCERTSWNLDSSLVAETLDARARSGRLPKAVVAVHLLGQCADLAPLVEACERHGVALVEDAAEALGATYRGRPPGGFGSAGIFSFNGNKIITTSGGGMLVSPDGDRVAHARKLASQAREPVAHYEHAEIGYNYRMSNLLAAVGRGQLQALEARVSARRRMFAGYEERLSGIPGLEMQPEAPWGTHTRWLTCLTVDAPKFGAGRDEICAALESRNIEARPIWKPMHRQPVFAGSRAVGGAVAEDLFARAVCLPSGSAMTDTDLDRVTEAILDVHRSRSRSVRTA